jgi:hypothetical protein
VETDVQGEDNSKAGMRKVCVRWERSVRSSLAGFGPLQAEGHERGDNPTEVSAFSFLRHDHQQKGSKNVPDKTQDTVIDVY